MCFSSFPFQTFWASARQGKNQSMYTLDFHSLTDFLDSLTSKSLCHWHDFLDKHLSRATQHCLRQRLDSQSQQHSILGLQIKYKMHSYTLIADKPWIMFYTSMSYVKLGTYIKNYSWFTWSSHLTGQPVFLFVNLATLYESPVPDLPSWCWAQKEPHHHSLSG